MRYLVAREKKSERESRTHYRTKRKLNHKDECQRASVILSVIMAVSCVPSDVRDRLLREGRRDL